MTWLHQCRPPGDFSIWLHRRTSGAGWECRGCGQLWLLARRRWETLGGGYSFWEWQKHNAPAPDEDDQASSVYADAERAPSQEGRDDGGYQYTPSPQIGFRSNDA